MDVFHMKENMEKFLVPKIVIYMRQLYILMDGCGDLFLNNSSY